MIQTRCSKVLFVAAVVGLAMLAWARPVIAQRDSGVMEVRAVDPDGAPLPGVLVVVAGPVGRRPQHTGIDGSARFPGQYPGEGYTVTFTLDGFKTIVREGLIIGAGRTTEFEMVMELSTVEETTTVLGESPVVDTRRTNIAGSYSDDLIDKTPAASGLWAGVMDHVPGVMSSLDVGGNDSGQQSPVFAYGSELVNNSYNVNGGDVTDQGAVGASTAYFAVGALEEVNVSLAAQDIEIKTPGVNMNMVVKSGSNDWHAGVRYFYEGPNLVSDNVDEELQDQGVTEGTPNELLSDLDVQVGGPIWRDRAWFFVDYWNFDLEKVVLGLDERDGTELTDWTLNINAQLSDNHKISGRYIRSKKYRNNRQASRSRPYLGSIQDSGTQIPQLQWQAVLNQNVFSDVRFSATRLNFPRERRDGESRSPDPSYVNRPARYDFSLRNYVRRPSNPVLEFLVATDTDSLDWTTSWYVTGQKVSQDVKFGLNFQNIHYALARNLPNGHRPFVRSNRVGDPQYDPDNNPSWADGVPVEVRLYNPPVAGRDGGSPDCFVRNADCWAPNNAFAQEGRSWGLFVQDTITVANRVTISAGLRFDRAFNWNPEQNRLDSPWCAGASTLLNPEFFCGGTFPAQEVAFYWNNLTPRIGVVYDIMGDGRWAAKFNYSRYPEQLGLNYGDATNVNSIASEDWDWFDPNGDGVFQFGEQSAFRSQSIPGVGNRIDPELTSPMTDEITFGVDHELFDNILVSVTGIFRGRTNDVGTVDIGRPFGDMLTNDRCIAECTPTYNNGDARPLEDPWAPVQTVDPGNDGIIGTDDDGLPVTVWALDPATVETSVELTTNSNAWGFHDGTDYKGVSFVVSKRWSNNWQVLASYDYGRGYNQEEGVDPNELYNGRRQEPYASRPHNFKVTGNYLFAEPVGVNLGMFIRAQSGEPVQAWYYYDGSVLDTPNGPYPNQDNTEIAIDAGGEGNEVGSFRPEREDFVTIVDIRAEKQITIGRYGVLHFYFDVFNLFNSNVVTEFDWNLGTSYGEIQHILPPRVIRLGGAWDF